MARTTIEEAESIVLSGVYEYIYDVADNDELDLSQLALSCQAPFSRAFLLRVIASLKGKGLVQSYSDEFEFKMLYSITDKGWIEAENLPSHSDLLKVAQIVPVSNLIPAADRIVDLNHNSDDYREIDTKFSELKDDLRESNDVGNLSASDVTVALKEVEDLSSDLQRPRVRVSAYIARVKSTLGWIASKAAETVVGIAAAGLLALILKFLGVVG